MSVYPYSVGQEIHSILRATFDAPNVHAYQSHDMSTQTKEGIYVFIVDVRESHMNTRVRKSGMRCPIVYSFGVIVQPVNHCILLDTNKVRELFDQCELSDDAKVGPLSENDKFAHSNLVFIIRAYDDNGECGRCMDGLAHSVWTWLKYEDQMIPDAFSRIISCSARTIDKVLMREVRALNMMICEFAVELMSLHPLIQVPSYIPHIHLVEIHESEQDSAIDSNVPADGIVIHIHSHPRATTHT